MAVKNSVFRKNWLGSKMGVMRTTFLLFLTQPGHTFRPQKAKIIPSQALYLRQKLYYYQFCEFKTE